ncbi:MAG: phosphotransferase [Nocardioides sp.]
MSTSVPTVRGYHDLRPLPGGHSGEMFLARPDGDAAAPLDEVVLRIYGAGHRRRGPEAPGVQTGVLRLVSGLVPAPRLVEWRSVEYGAETGLLVMSRLPGVPLVDVLPTATDALQRRLGASLGEALGRLSGIALTGVGSFLDHRLTLGPYPEHAESLVGWFDHLHRNTELELLYPHEADAVRAGAGAQPLRR